jgi:diaminohydroxyphosphoribosylaminopyrimidine deaminase/5-amino-6-(5-phosphoribosylamino)uracil reductase
MDNNTRHEKYMQRCIELARFGLGYTAPNPLVGSVIVYEDKIIGEGYHRGFGKAHAEVNAIGSVKNRELLKKSTLYVNLEPCAHKGKTPPCTDLIIREGIPTVVIGTSDPHPLVSGKGIQCLSNAGIKIIYEVNKNDCVELNKRFFTFHILKRPYIILKWAQSVDGFMDVTRQNNETSEPNWISNEISRKLVHKWRSEEQAIMVGTNTALLDNPRLNVREWHGKNPIRILLDRSLRLPTNLHLFDNSIKTIIFNEIKNYESGNCVYIKIHFDQKLISSVLEVLYKLEIQSVIIEGGKMLLESFISSGLWDEARVFTGTKSFSAGIKAPVIESRNINQTYIVNDLLTIYYKYQVATQF